MVLDGLAPARRRLVLVVAAAVAVVLVAVLAVVVVRALSAPESVAQDEPGPVLVLPGYGGSTDSVAGLADSLEATGRDVTVFDPPDGGVGDLAEQAAAFGSLVDEVLDRTGAASVDVVGYSAGGVVARLWVRDEGGDAVARRVVTLGSPHHGTDVAALATGSLGCPEACQQLDPNSSVLAALNAGDETPEGPEWVSVWTADDETVTPPDSASLDGALDLELQQVCPDLTVSHGDLPDDPVVRVLVARFLDPARPAAPTTCPS